MYNDPLAMAGHSKWNNIKHRKGAMDAKRGKLFGNLAKQIRVAVKEGGSDDPKFNPNLRLALDRARAANMPKDNIARAIERGLGKTASGASIQETVYEGFGPGGVALLIVALTDNTNRTTAELKGVLSKHQGNLGGPGSASYLFERDQSGDYKPNLVMPLDDADRRKLTELVSSLESLEDVEEVYPAAELASQVQS